LGVLFNKNGNSNEEITNSVYNGRNNIRSLNSVLWDKSPRMIRKKIINTTMVQSIVIHRAEAWDANRKNRNTLSAAEMDYIQRSYRRTRLGRIHNETTREFMEVEKDIID
jgi:hypothetical protein